MWISKREYNALKNELEELKKNMQETAIFVNQLREAVAKKNKPTEENPELKLLQVAIEYAIKNKSRLLSEKKLEETRDALMRGEVIRF